MCPFSSHSHQFKSPTVTTQDSDPAMHLLSRKTQHVAATSTWRMHCTCMLLFDVLNYASYVKYPGKHPVRVLVYRLQTSSGTSYCLRYEVALRVQLCR